MYLHPFDFDTHIRYNDLLQIVDNDVYLIEKAQGQVIRKVKNKLRNYFDIDQIFIDLDEYNSNKQYSAGDYVYFNKGDVQNPSYRVATYQAANPSSGNPPYLNGNLNKDFWNGDDPRHGDILDIVVTLILCKILKRVSPNKTPEFRQNDCKAAMKYLNDISEGNIDTDLPLLPDDDRAKKPVIMISSKKNNWQY